MELFLKTNEMRHAGLIRVAEHKTIKKLRKSILSFLIKLL